MYFSLSTLAFAGAVSSASYFLTDWTVSVIFQEQRDIAYSQTIHTVLQYLEQNDLKDNNENETHTGVHELESVSDTNERLISSVNTILETSLLNQHETEKKLRKHLLVQFLSTYFISCGVWYGLNLVI